MQNIDGNKVRLDANETAMIVEGLEAAARENFALAAHARRLGFIPQANDLANKAERFASLGDTARRVRIDRITIRHS